MYVQDLKKHAQDRNKRNRPLTKHDMVFISTNIRGNIMALDCSELSEAVWVMGALRIDIRKHRDVFACVVNCINTYQSKARRGKTAPSSRGSAMFFLGLCRMNVQFSKLPYKAAESLLLILDSPSTMQSLNGMGEC
jgi:hypothetical protein